MNKRPLTLNERKILEKLLSVSFSGVDDLRSQLQNCIATPTEDDDNYGSIYLFPKGGSQADISLRVPVEGTMQDVDGGVIDVLLHVVEGRLHELEIVKLEGNALNSEIDPRLLEVIVNN